MAATDGVVAVVVVDVAIIMGREGMMALLSSTAAGTIGANADAMDRRRAGTRRTNHIETLRDPMVLLAFGTPSFFVVIFFLLIFGTRARGVLTRPKTLVARLLLLVGWFVWWMFSVSWPSLLTSIYRQCKRTVDRPPINFLEDIFLVMRLT